MSRSFPTNRQYSEVTALLSDGAWKLLLHKYVPHLYALRYGHDLSPLAQVVHLTDKSRLTTKRSSFLAQSPRLALLNLRKSRFLRSFPLQAMNMFPCLAHGVLGYEQRAVGVPLRCLGRDQGLLGS